MKVSKRETKDKNEAISDYFSAVNQLKERTHGHVLGVGYLNEIVL